MSLTPNQHDRIFARPPVINLTRRDWLASSLLAFAAPAVLLSADLNSKEKSPSTTSGFCSYTDLIDHIKSQGHKPRTLGFAPDGSPVIAVKTGGEKTPAIFISAGAHATEQAGVAAAVELIDDIETEHQVYVIPCRDPIGLTGYRYALRLGLGEEPAIDTVDDVTALLREKGEILYDHEGLLLVQIGETGYANGNCYLKFEKGAAILESLKGRRIYFPSNDSLAPGAGPLERAYTLVVTPEGEVLHINRFHDTPWAPVEVDCTRRLMAEIDPKLVFDLHEYGGNDFWMSARRQRTDDDERWELRMGHAAVDAVKTLGTSFPEEDYRPGSFFEKLAPGLFWLNPQARGEGLNLVDFAARNYGPGFTVETGMRQPFAKRVEMHKTVVKTAVKLFEERYA